MGQLIYIEQKDKDEATRLLKGFADSDIRKKAFINSLGAELIMKYLAQDGINVSNIFNMHNIFRIREGFEVADIMLPNVHIDVRMVYDENLIFVPKSHFEYNLVPDIYVVLKISEDGSYVDFLGFFEPKIIDKSKQNNEYYFVNQSELMSPDKFTSFVKAFNGNTTQEIDETDEIKRYILSMADNDIAASDKKELIGFLKKSASLREDMIEFDNFEWLSYTLTHEDDVEKNFNKSVDEFDVFEETDDFNDNKTDNIESAEDSMSEETLDSFDISDNELLEDASATVGTEALIDLQPDENLDIDNVIEDLPEVQASDLTDADLNIDEIGDLNDNQGPQPKLNEEATEDIQPDEGVIDTASADIIPETDNENSDDNILDDLVNMGQSENVSELENNDFSEELFEMPKIDEPNDVEEISNAAEVTDFENAISENPTTVTSDDSDNLAELENLTDIEQLLSVSDGESAQVSDINLSESNDAQTRSFENSTVISSENPVVGEIQIDVNADDTDDSIEVLYDNQQDNDIAHRSETPERGKNVTLVVAAFAAILAIGGVAGYFALNHKNQFSEDIPPIPEEIAPPTDVAENPLPEDAIKSEPKTVNANENAGDLVAKARSGNSHAIKSEYIEVQRLGWAVPDYVSYNTVFKNYLQSAGKGLKLALSSELLSATEYPYSNQIFVQVELSKKGELLSHSIVKSSGSTQIDKIVLQTVKDTLNAVKVPTSVIVGDSITLTLKIYL